MRLGQTWWQRRFISAMKAAGIDYKGRNITAHSLRHSLNTHLVSSGLCNMVLVQAYLGWSSTIKYLTSVQQGYTHIKAIHLEEVATAIDRLYNGVNLQLVNQKMGLLSKMSGSFLAPVKHQVYDIALFQLLYTF